MTRILRGCLALATLTMLSIAVLSLLPFLGRSTHAAAQTFGDGSVGAPFSAPCPGIGGIGSIGAIGGGGIGGLGGGIGAVGGGNLSGGGIGAIGGGGIGGIGTIAGIGSVSGVGGIGGVGAISGGCAFSGFGGGGGFGGFVVATPQSLVTAGDVMPLVVAWIVPAPEIGRAHV